MLPIFSVRPSHLSLQWVFTVLLLFLTAGNALQAQNPGQIYDLIVDKKIDKAVERRNKVYDNSKKSDLLLIDLCDCLLFNTPEYSAFDPEKSLDIFNRLLLPQSKERDLIRFLDKKDNSLDSIRVQIELNLYREACQANTEESYAHFISLCPDSQWAKEAYTRQEECTYRQALEKGTIEAYNYFLFHYATSPHVIEITRLADKATFAQLDNTIEDYQQFIDLYPQSPLVEEARERIYRLAYAQARDTHTKEAYLNLLDKYPDLPMKEEVQSAIESFDYMAITQQPSQYAYDQFVRNYPNSTYLTPLKDWLGNLQKGNWHWSSQNLRGYVKSLQETTSTINNGKEIQTTTTYRYNQLGQLIYVEKQNGGKSIETCYLYHPDFTLNSITSQGKQKNFYYNLQREIVRITESDNSGKEPVVSTLTYGDERLATRTDFSQSSKEERKTDYTYNESGNLISSKSYETDKPQNTTTTYYTPDGNVKLEIDINGRTRREKIYYYNEHNDVAKITFVSGGVKEDTTYEYTYDEHDNWITRTQISGDQRTTTQRTIEYYSYE